MIQSDPKQSSGSAVKGTLTVAGLGIRPNQLTIECKQAIVSADVVFVVNNNLPGLLQLQDLNPDVRELHYCYGIGKRRKETYEEMTNLVLDEVRSGLDVCFAAYGHPGVFANPTHDAIRQARKEGFEAVMLPGISAEDCLFADLGLDPARSGCQSFEASDFMLRQRVWDPYSTLVIWQIKLIGISTLPEDGTIPAGLDLMLRRLIDVYGTDHKAILYEASMYPLCKPRINTFALSDVRAEHFRLETTMIVRPLGPCPRRDEEFASILY